jgi:hypothetical protein
MVLPLSKVLRRTYEHNREQKMKNGKICLPKCIETFTYSSVVSKDYTIKTLI